MILILLRVQEISKQERSESKKKKPETEAEKRNKLGMGMVTGYFMLYDAVSPFLRRPSVPKH